MRKPLAFAIIVLGFAAARAQEAWCTANSVNCVMSETFQSTSYTRVIDYGTNTGAEWLGNLTGSKPGQNEGGVPSSIQDIFGTNANTFAGALAIAVRGVDNAAAFTAMPSSASGILRFLRMAGDSQGGGNQPSTYNFGHMGISLGTAKRISLRWYEYISTSPVYQFKNQGTCSNGKLWHNNAGSYNVSPMITFESYNDFYHAYSFNEAGFGGGPSPSWVWPGHSGFDGWASGKMVGPNGNNDSLRGKWTRHEVVIRRPRVADSSTLGYDFEYWVTNVTDGGSPVMVAQMSAGCSSCVFPGPVAFTWGTGVRPVNDMNVLHMVSYRQDGCNGWKGWMYAVVAKWDRDDCVGITCNGGNGFPTSGQTGPMIGRASEVEGGGGQTCGNNSIEGTEICDGNQVPSTCAAQGFVGGTLQCSGTCLSYDTSGCFNAASKRSTYRTGGGVTIK